MLQKHLFVGPYCLESVAQRLRARGDTIQTHVAVHPQTAAGILEAAQAHDCDLIALATHGRGGLRRLLMGSVADKLLRDTSLPVLVQRPTTHL